MSKSRASRKSTGLSMSKLLDMGVWKIVGVAALVVVIVAGAVFLLAQYRAGKAEVTVTIEEIKQVAQLATVEYTISDAYKWQKPRQWYETKNLELMVLARGKVKGSVDLEKMQLEVSNEADEKHVTLIFGPGAILISDPEICPAGCIRTYDMKDVNLFTGLTAEDRNKQLSAAIGCLKQAAIDDGIREKTAAEAKVVLTRFLEHLGYVADIKFAPEDLAAMPATTSSKAKPSCVSYFD
ncbi:MAG: DUF4230 domain-containing protein [Bacteroidota bacterium]